MNKKLILVIAGGIVVLALLVNFVIVPMFGPKKETAKPGTAQAPAVETLESKIKGIKAEFKSNSSDKREEAISKLAGIKDPLALPLLLDALNDGNARVREKAAKLLGELGEKDAIGPLCKAMKDKDHFVPFYSAISLAKLKSSYGVNLLLKRLNSDIPSSSKVEVINALEKLKYTKALPVILKFCADKNPEIQKAAVSAKNVIEMQKKLDISYEWYRIQVRKKKLRNANDKLYILVNKIRNKEEYKSLPLDFSAIDKEIKEIQQELERKSQEEIKKMQDSKKEEMKSKETDKKTEKKTEAKKEEKKEESKKPAGNP